jgi:uncharacterized membrane-anchored protein
VRNLSLRFWAILALQVVLILAVPAQAWYTQVNGRSLVLQTAPVDPYNLLQGYSVTLSYDISNPLALAKLPGGKELEARRQAVRDSLPRGDRDNVEFYVILQAPTNTEGQPPPAWKPVSISNSRPENLPANQIALRGSDRQGRVLYGVETYFIPEDQRDELNEKIRQVQAKGGKPAIVVEAKVGSGGNALPIAIWLENKRYQF